MPKASKKKSRMNPIRSAIAEARVKGAHMTAGKAELDDFARRGPAKLERDRTMRNKLRKQYI